jgi:hypothetical protein
VTIAPDGFMSVNLAPNLGASPAGLYYTAIYNMSDGSTSTEYWVVPAAAQAALGQVRAQLMPAAQAVQAVDKAYVDQAIQQLSESLLTASGGTLTGPLFLNGDPTQPLQAADKHYVDSTFSLAVPLAGANMTGPLAAPSVNGVQSPVAGSAQTTLQATLTAAGTNGAALIPPNYTGTDGFTNPSGVYVADLRQGSSQQYERSVKEFGAVCDGVTDDTSALQAAINYAQSHGVALSIPQGTCKTHTLAWHGESIGGASKQVSALMGFPGQDVLASVPDSMSLLSYTRIHDLTIYVDQSVDASCSPAEGRAHAGSCAVNRPLETNSIFSSGGSGLAGTAGAGAAWSVGNCAIAMPAVTGLGGNGLRNAEIENLEIVATGVDPMAMYAGAHSTHTCGLYLAQWPQFSEFRNIDIRGLNTGIAVGPLAVTVPAGLTADSNRFQNLTIQATHGFTMAAGSNNVIDNLVLTASNSAATSEPPTGLVLDFAGPQQGWTVRNAVVQPAWNAVQPALIVSANGGAVTGVTVGPEHGLGFDPYGTQIPLTFSGACTAVATASVNSDGSIGTVVVTAGGVGCSGTTTATLNAAGTWDTAAPVNLIAGQNMTFFGGNLLKGNGGYTVWNAAGSQSYGAQMGGGGTLPGGGAYPALVLNNGIGAASGFTGSANVFRQLGLSGGLKDNGLGNSLVQANAAGNGEAGVEPARLAANTVSADFALLGAGAANQAFTSLNDLFLSAEDLLWQAGESGGTGSQFGKDAKAPVTGSYVKAIGGAWDTQGTWHVRGVANALVLGSGFPVGPGTWYVAAKSDVATTQELKLTGVNGSGASCTFADKTLSLTTSWQVFAVPYNTVTGNSSCDNSTQGNPVTAAGLAPGTTTNVETAWLSFLPAFQSITLAQAPTLANQAATKGYVDSAVNTQIVSGSGLLPITGGTLTGPLNAPAVNGTTNCALSASVSACMAAATSALIPSGTTGSYTQSAAQKATAACVYDLTQGGKITQVNPAALGLGYTSSPLVTVTNTGTNGSGLAVTANVTGGQVSSYTIVNGGSGYTSCPSVSVAAPPAAPAAIPVLDQRKGAATYGAVVRVDDFGCAADGVTDDTECINNAISWATNNGASSGSIALTSGKTYYVTQVMGYMPTGADDGSAPASGDTCAMANAAQTPPIAGSACVPLPPETPGQLGFAIRVPNGLTIYGNSATIKSNFSEFSTSFSLAPPFIAMFGSEQSYGGISVYDLTITHAFIGWAVPGSTGYWLFRNVNTNSVGISILANILQLSQLRDLNFNSMAGIVVGGWWQCRATSQCPDGIGDFADNIVIDGYVYSGTLPSPPSGGVLANQNGLDTWFNTYFFHVGDNATRMTDSQYAALGVDKDAFWRGIFGVGIAYYSRTGRPSNSDIVRNYWDKLGMSYPVVISTPVNLLIDGMSAEGAGDCQNGSPWGTPVICPNPYDPVNTQLEAAILLQDPTSVTIRNVQTGGVDAEEVVGESWRNTAAQTLGSLRHNVSSSASIAASRYAVANPQPDTDRTIHNYSNVAAPNGTEDSGEECFDALGSYGAGSDNDEWCMRYALSTYSGSASIPRYFVLENEYNGGHFNGPAAVQMPGLRVRTGAISPTDTTLPVTDFSSQAFTIGGGAVSGNTCATLGAVTLPGALTSDGVLFVRAPSSAAPLQLSGTITGANTMSLSVCNPSTGSLNYPAGTYTAFILAGAAPPATPAVSGGTPTSTSPLTTTVGDLVTANTNGAPGRLAGNTTSQPAVLTQTGTGTASSIPAWQTAPAFSGANLTSLNATNLTTGTVAIANGGTGASTAAQALTNLGGANLSAGVTEFAGDLTAAQIGALYQVDQFAGSDFGAQLGACLSGLNATYGGTCDARNFTGSLSMGSNLTISTANATVLLPCATIATANQIIVTAGTRNVTLRGCALRGASNASGSQGGTVFLYSGPNSMIRVGDPTYAADTSGFHLDNVVINTTAAANASAQGFVAYRTQEMDLESLYFLGNQNQTGMTLDGTGNYIGGTFFDIQFDGFQIALNAIGHQASNPATTDWMNAGTFVRLHIDCPTSGGGPISGTYGINLLQGDGNSFTGGDVEGCNTAVHLGPNAQNNTFVGVRNEVSNNQVVADAGSGYNSWITGGTMFTGQLTDNGTRNSFLDTFHRSFNGMKGDWYGSQQDATVTNHYRIGIGTGNERGLLDRYQTDYGYRWTMGLSDATAGAQFYQILDELNNVYRFSIGQYNNGQASTNNQTVINAAGTGAIVLNGSNNSGTGGVIVGSGGPTETTVATINNAGNALFSGTLQVGGASTFTGSTTVKNQVDAEIDQFLWAGATTSQKESYTYKDWNGNSQWYMVKDASNNWALNSATGGLDSFKAYQSSNSGDTYIDASNPTGVVRINYETGSGTAFNIYGGASSSLYASFTGANAIKFPGLAAGTGTNCLQIDNSGYVTNTGTSCGTGSGSGTVSSGTAGQIAYYTANGNALGGTSAVPVTAGGTGANTAAGARAGIGAAASGANSDITSLGALSTAIPVTEGGTGAATAAGALTSLGALPLTGGTLTGAVTGPGFGGELNAASATYGAMPTSDVSVNVNNAIAAIVPVPSGALHGTVTLDPTLGVYSQLHTIYVPTGTDFDCRQSTLNWTGPGRAFGTGVGYQVVIGSPALSAQDDLSQVNNCFLENNGADKYAAYPGGLLFTIMSGADPGANSGWHSSTAYTVGAKVTVHIGNAWYQQTATGITGSGLSGTSTPPFSVTSGVTAADSQVTWTSNGAESVLDWPLFAVNTTYTPITGALLSVLGSDGNYYSANLAQDATYSGMMKTGICVSASTLPTFPLTLGAGVTSGTCFLVNEGLEQPFNTADAGGAHESVSNTSIDGPFVGFSGGANFYVNHYYNDEVNHAFNGIQDSLCGPTSGELFVWTGGVIGNSLSNSVMLNCTGHEWEYNGSTDYGNGLGLAGAAAAAEISGSHIDLVGSTLHAEHNAGALIASSGGSIAVDLSGASFVEDQKGVGFPLLTCALASNVATFTNAAGYATGLAVSSTVYISSTTCPDLNGQVLTVASIATNGTGFTAASTSSATDNGTGGTAQANPVPVTAEGVTLVGSTYTATFTAVNAFRSNFQLTPQGLTGCPALNGQVLTVNAATGTTFSADVSLVPGIAACSGSETAAVAVASTESGLIVTPANSGDTLTLNSPQFQSSHPVTTAVSFPNDTGAQIVVNAPVFVSAPSISVPTYLTVNTPATGTGARPAAAVICSGTSAFSGWNSSGTMLGGNCTTGWSGDLLRFVVGGSPKLASDANGNLGVGSVSYIGNSLDGACSYTATGIVCTRNIPDGNTAVTSGSISALSTGNIHDFQNSIGVVASVLHNGAAEFPAFIDTGVTNAAALATNGSGQVGAAATTGTGATIVLAAGPTFTGNTTTFANGAAAEQDVVVQPGTGADQIGAFGWNNSSGASEWKLRKDASNYLRLTDVVNNLDREVFYQNGQTVINAGAGGNPAVINGSTGSGTGGLLVESGGSSPAAVLTVSGSGNTTATGFVSGKFMIGSGTMSLTAGAAAGTGPAIACASSHVCDGVSGTVTLTTGTSPATGTLLTLGFPNTHTNQANCVVMPTLSGAGLVTTLTWSESTTALTLTANAALAASTAYQIRYWCGGN